MTKEQLRMQMLAGIITEGQYKEKTKKLDIIEIGRSAANRAANAANDEYNRRQGMTPKDNWEGNEDGFIKYLMGISTVRWEDVDGKQELVPITGFEYVDDYFDDYDDKTSYAYNHAMGRDFLDWMLMVRERYNDLKKSGKIKNPNKAKAKREDREY